MFHRWSTCQASTYQSSCSDTGSSSDSSDEEAVIVALRDLGRYDLASGARDHLQEEELDNYRYCVSFSGQG